jgi:hypothetical protein
MKTGGEFLATGVQVFAIQGIRSDDDQGLYKVIDVSPATYPYPSRLISVTSKVMLLIFVRTLSETVH